MPLKDTVEVIREMRAKGLANVPLKELGTTVGRAARALRALGVPAIVRKSLTMVVPAIAKREKLLSVWTSEDGLAQLEVVTIAAKLVAKSLERTDRYTLAEVARLLNEDPGSLAELRAAHALDAPEMHLEAMVWGVRCRLVKTYGEKRT